MHGFCLLLLVITHYVVAGFPVIMGVLKEDRDDVEMVLDILSSVYSLFFSLTPVPFKFKNVSVESFLYKKTEARMGLQA